MSETTQTAVVPPTPDAVVRKSYAVADVRGFKLLADGPGGFSGYANPFGKLDSVGDITLPGAFAGAIGEFLTHGFIPVDHDWSRRVGYPRAAREDEYGLWIDVAFHSTTAAQDARTIAAERMAAGLSERLSIGFTLAEFEYVSGADAVQHLKDPTPDEIARCAAMSRVRLIRKVKQLFEVSLVSVPAAPGSDVIGVKSLDTGDTADTAATETPAAVTTKALDTADAMDLVAMCVACCLACEAMCRQCAAMTDDPQARDLFNQCAELCYGMRQMCVSCQWVCYAPAATAILGVCMAICAACCRQCAACCATCVDACPTDATRDLMVACIAVCEECAGMCEAALAETGDGASDGANPDAAAESMTEMRERIADITTKAAATGDVAADLITKSTTSDEAPAARRLAEQSDAVLAAVEGLTTRYRAVLDLRTKAGRRFSRATEERVLANAAALEERAKDMRDMIAEGQPETDADLTVLHSQTPEGAGAETVAAEAVITPDDAPVYVDQEIANGLYAALITEYETTSNE